MKKYEATIGSYLGIAEYDAGGYYFQLNQNDKHKIEGCIFGNYIYDLKNSKRYYVLKRDENGFLKRSEYAKIKTNVEYALEVKEKTVVRDGLKVKKLPGLIKR